MHLFDLSTHVRNFDEAGRLKIAKMIDNKQDNHICKYENRKRIDENLCTCTTRACLGQINANAHDLDIRFIFRAFFIS